MPLTQLNHYFVRANDLEETKAFYCDVLGLEQKPRPNFPFPGYWLGFSGEQHACIHMGPHGIANHELYYLSDPTKAATSNAGVVDHIAFLATDAESFRARFKQMGLAHRDRTLPQFDLYQMFINDPNGLVIELNFYGLKDVAWGGEDYSKMPKAS
jgi:catechol 2,3-dioxygenase-like lactoylglutathione lyase family enzyme